MASRSRFICIDVRVYQSYRFFILASLSPDNCFSVQSTTIRLGFSPIFKYFPYFTTIFSISIIYFIEEELGNKEKVIEI